MENKINNIINYFYYAVACYSRDLGHQHSEASHSPLNIYR